MDSIPDWALALFMLGAALWVLWNIVLPFVTMIACLVGLAIVAVFKE